MINIVPLAVILVIVALVFLGSGLSFTNSRRHREPEHESYAPARPRSHVSVLGLIVGLLLGVPLLLFLLALIVWFSAYETRETAVVEVPAAISGESTMPYEESSAPMSGEEIQQPLLAESPTKLAEIESSDLEPLTSSEDLDVSEPPAHFDETFGRVDSAATGGSESETRSVTFFQPPVLAELPPHLLLMGGFLSLALLIGAGVWIAHRREHWSLSGMSRSAVRSAWVVPILASIAWVGYLVWPHLSVEPLVRNTDYNPSQSDFVRYVDEKNGDIETQEEFLQKARKMEGLEGELPVSAESELPEWVMQGVEAKGGILHVPVRSGWRISEDASDHEARAQAMRTIRQDFAQAYPASELWRIDAALNDLDAVVAERVETKLFPYSGNQKRAMYRTHMLIEISDNVRGDLVSQWWPNLQKFRMTMLIAFGGLLALTCFASSACLTLDQRTEGKYRRWLRTATVLVVVAGAAAAHGVLDSLWFSYSV